MLRLALSQPVPFALEPTPRARRTASVQVDLRHRDLSRLERLHDEYFGHADDLEMVAKSSRAA